MPILTVLASTQGSAITPAVQWIEDLLLGTLGTTIVVIAVAMVGFRMLRGDLSPEMAARVLLGVFILFGASEIARGLAALSGGPEERAPFIQPQSFPPLAPLSTPMPRSPNYDPYAGAAVPNG